MAVFVPTFEAGGPSVPSIPPDPKLLGPYLLYWAAKIRLYLAQVQAWVDYYVDLGIIEAGIKQGTINPRTLLPYVFTPISYEKPILDSLLAQLYGIVDASPGFNNFLTFADAYGDNPSYANEQTICAEAASLLGWCLSISATMIPQADAVIAIADRSSQNAEQQTALDEWAVLVEDMKTELVNDFPDQLAGIFLIQPRVYGLSVVVSSPVQTLAGAAP